MPWLTFLVAYGLGVLLLTIPGYILARALNISRLWSICVSPLFSCGSLWFVGELLFRLHIYATAYTLVASAVILAIVSLVFGRVVLGTLPACKQFCTHKGALETITFPHISPWHIIAYVSCGIIATYLLFVSCLSHPDNINLAWDMTQHLNATRTMMYEGMFSSFHINAYAPYEAQFAPWDISKPSFYPATWNILCACIAEIAHINLSTAANALNSAVCSIAVPLGMLSIISCVTQQKPYTNKTRYIRSGAQWAGCIISCVIIIFPWSMLVWGPIYPYLLGLSLTPLFCSIWMSGVMSWTQRSTRVQFVLLMVFATIPLLFIHPSVLFTCALFMAPWCAQQIYTSNKPLRISRTKVLNSHHVAYLFCACCIIVWCILYLIIAKKGMLAGFYWEKYTDLPSALRSILGMSFAAEYHDRMIQTPQPALTILVGIGFWVALRKLRASWLVCAWIWHALICMYATTFDLPGKVFLAGFWYTDPQRLAANTGVLTIILACMGAGWLISTCMKILKYKRKNKDNEIVPKGTLRGMYVSSTIAVCVIIICAIVTVRFDSPLYNEAAPQVFRSAVTNEYTKHAILTPEERAFLERVQGILKKRGWAPIINNPYDGSVAAYGMYGLPCMYRHPNTFNLTEYQSTSVLREQLVNYRLSPTVQKALKQTGVRYVLHLADVGQVLYPRNYHTWQFSGIDNVNDTTPGFTILAAEGEMRLYEIDDVAAQTL